MIKKIIYEYQKLLNSSPVHNDVNKDWIKSVNPIDIGCFININVIDVTIDIIIIVVII